MIPIELTENESANCYVISLHIYFVGFLFVLKILVGEIKMGDFYVR